MENTVPAWLSISFILIVGVMYSLLILGVRYANNVTRAASGASLIVMRFAAGGWVLVTGLLSIQGFFLDFSTVPPRIAGAAFICAASFSIFAFSPLTTRWLGAIQQKWIIGAQTFRLFVEFVLVFLAQTPLLPKLMTPAGRNFDIIIGLSAPVMAWWVHKAGADNIKKPLMAWNILGIALLANVVVHGILSAPSPMQRYFVEPANTAIGYFPFVWLPAFLVPLALFLHIISLRKLMGKAP